MKAIYTKPSKLIDYGGEFIDIGGDKTEVEILQFVTSFWGTKAICRVGNIFKEIPRYGFNVFQWWQPLPPGMEE
jgi:hypothetical protein